MPGILWYNVLYLYLMIMYFFFLHFRSDTPPHRIREGVVGPIQQPGSNTGTSNQTPPPVGTQVGAQGSSHHLHHYMSGQGNYSNFPDQGARMLSHQQQQRPTERGNQPHNFTHQDEAPRGSQQGQIWGAPHSQCDRNSRVELPPVESSSHHHHHSQHPQQPQFPLHPHKPENSRDRVVEATTKKTDSPPLHQPSTSSCSSSSSARDDGNVKVAMHHHHQRENETGIGQNHSERGSSVINSSHVKQEISFITASPPPNQHGSHTPPQQQQQQHFHSKSNQRGGREHKTETHWGPRPGNTNSSGSSHGRRANNNAVGGNNSGEDSNTVSDHKPSSQTVNTNKRAGPIKKPALKDMKKDGGEVDGGEKTNVGLGKDKEQDAGHFNSVKQDVPSSSQNTSVSPKDESTSASKSRNGGKERFSGGGGSRGPKDGDIHSGFSGSASRREIDCSFERGRSTTHHHGVPAKGSRASRGRGGEFFGRGRGYRGTYTAAAGPSGGGRGRIGGRSGRDFRSSIAGGHQNELRGEGAVGVGRHGQDRSQHNPARARNRSETRSEGSEYEEIPKRRRERGSETGSDSGGSDIGHSDKDEIQKPNTKNGSDHVISTGNMSSAPPRGSQARVFTPRGVPSRRGRGGGSGGGNIYRGSCNVGVTSGTNRVGSSSASHGGPSKSSASGRKQQSPPQNSGPKDMGKGTNGGEKKDKIADGSQAQSQASKPPQPSLPATTPASLGSAENGGVVTQHGGPINHTSNSGGPNVLQLSTPRGFERPPRRRRHGRSQHQQDKPPRFRRLKERENAARINGGVGVIGGGRSSSPSINSVQDSNGTPLTATMSGSTQNTNQNNTVTSNNNSGGGHLSNSNSHHHHHYNNQGIAAQSHPQHHHSHGAKSPDFTNQNSDQANEEWETASESSDFTEFRDREGGGGGKSYSSHHPYHLGRGGGGSGSMVEREMTGKEPSTNKRSFSSQRPGMERQNRRVNPGGGRGPRGPAGSGTSGPSNGGGSRGEKRVNMTSPKNRK